MKQTKKNDEDNSQRKPNKLMEWFLSNSLEKKINGKHLGQNQSDQSQKEATHFI